MYHKKLKEEIQKIAEAKDLEIQCMDMEYEDLRSIARDSYELS